MYHNMKTMKYIGLYATFVHTQAKLGQVNLLRMVRVLRVNGEETVFVSFKPPGKY